jgi:acyl-coenzyme A synthetase/AMP-(fatty) acid ligase
MEAGSRIEGRTLHPHPGNYTRFDTSQVRGTTFAETVLSRARAEVAERGDRRWLSNGARRVTGSSRVPGPESHSLAEVETRARQLARILAHTVGLRRGEVVHLVMPGNADMYFPVLGTWLLQGVVSPADPGLAAEVIGAQMKEAAVKVVFCCVATLEKVRRARELIGADTPVIVLDAKLGDPLMQEGREVSLESLREADEANSTGVEPPPPPEVVEENEAMMICWSSGTTGRPKGILHGSNLFFNLFARAGVARALQTTCMFHLGGFTSALAALAHGTEQIFIAPEDLEDNIELMTVVADQTSADAIFCGSHHLIQLAATAPPAGQQPAASVTLLLPVGTNTYHGIFGQLKTRFPSAFAVIEIYGQSEGGCLVALGVDQLSLGGVRCPALRVLQPDTGVALGPGAVGEIVYKSDTPMLGYLNQPEEDSKFFGKDGFLHSGDLGHYDDTGTLYFDGRLKELIKYKNFHLYPNELEELLLANEAVEDAAVFGRPEPMVQELVTALVVRRRGAGVTAAELVELVDGRVDDHKKLRGGVHFVERIPRNPQGKILRRSLNKLL